MISRINRIPEKNASRTRLVATGSGWRTAARDGKSETRTADCAILQNTPPPTRRILLDIRQFLRRPQNSEIGLDWSSRFLELWRASTWLVDYRIDRSLNRGREESFR